MFARKMQKFAGRKKSWPARMRRRRDARCLHAQQQEAVREVIEVEVNGVRRRSGVLIKKHRSTALLIQLGTSKPNGISLSGLQMAMLII
ncbi:hypothetical protein ACQJBY_006028 [Aegilops geniculata]